MLLIILQSLLLEPKSSWTHPNPAHYIVGQPYSVFFQILLFWKDQIRCMIRNAEMICAYYFNDIFVWFPDEKKKCTSFNTALLH